MITYRGQGQTLTHPEVERHYNHPQHGDGIVVWIDLGEVKFTRWVPMSDVVLQGLVV